jgi:hypothetical protein
MMGKSQTKRADDFITLHFKFIGKQAFSASGGNGAGDPGITNSSPPNLGRVASLWWGRLAEALGFVF